jgi:hypothetical protein
MSTTDEISKEKQRLGESLARIDAEREKLAGQLAELATTERVLARYSKGAQARNTGSATKPAARPTSPTLGDRVLALATGKTKQEITAACKAARPNHVGVVIARHKRAGRIEERDGKLYAVHSAAAA